MEKQENANVDVVEKVETEKVDTERITYNANLSRFDEEMYLSLSPQEKCDYLTTLINHSSKYESFWNLSLPIDSDPSISNEIISSFVVFSDENAKTPLDLYKADISQSGKSFVIVWSSFKNESKAIVKLK